MNEAEYLQILEEIGWLSEVPEEEAARLSAEISHHGEEDPEHAFVALSNYCFDIECVEGDRPYSRVLEGLARASGGRFSPEEIDEAFTDGAWILSFRHHGKRYEVSLPYSDDMFRSEAIDLVNQALVDGGIANRFEPLPAFDQIIYLTFVSEGTRQAAVDRGLIPNVPHLFGDEFGDD